jgi:Tfp pilus assembly protein PilV
MTTNQGKPISAPASSGFSMIDVLVAIVVTATALLALAALQGALTRNAADARARSQIAAYTEGLIDQLRSSGYSSIASGTSTISPVCTATATKQQAEACAAQLAAGISKLQTTITTTTYYSDSTGAFSASSAPSTILGTYDQVHLVSTWIDGTGQSRQFAADTIVSPIEVDQNNNALDSTALLPSTGNTPIVRQYNPGLTAGVIPIAIGDTTNSTAATNPQPEILGKNNNQFIGGVSFNVLTFTADDGTSNHESQITQNIATRVIRCNCKYGTQITSGVFAQPYRPTYWDASQSKYVSPSKASGSSSATGQDNGSAFVNGVYSPNQDTNCNICCRDHTDTGATGEIRFNPWTTDNTHYRWATTAATTMTAVPSTDSTNAYVNACRLIIVDGVYSVATDMQNYFFGLVATDTASNTSAPSGSTSTNTASSPLPTSTSKTNYQNFVVDYLLRSGGGSVGTGTLLTTSTTLTSSNYPLNSPSGPKSGNAAAGLYITDGLASSGGVSVPNNINIGYVTPSGKTASCIPTGNQDCRYMHARGLYVDHLEPVTLTALNNALSTCKSSTSTDLQDCVFPLLPFTTINLTQLADWSENHSGSGTASDVTVTNTVLTGGDPDQPLRGVVSALSTGTNNTTDNAVANIGLSNSGIIGTASQSGVSDTDENTNLTGSQQFTLTSGGVSASNSLAFDIVLSNPNPNSTNQYPIGLGTTVPSVSWLGVSAYYTSGSAASTKPCSSGTSPNMVETYVGSTTSKCTSQTPNLVTASGVPSGSTAGVQVAVSGYNVETTGTGGTGANCTTKSGSTVIQPTVTTCSVYAVSAVSVNGTAVPSWTSALSKGSSGTSVYGLTAISTIQVPSGLSSTSTTSPDLLQIQFNKDTVDSYTVNYTCTPATCTGSGGNKCTYTPGHCNQ